MLYASTEQFAIYHGDNRQILPTLAENSVDAIVTDPPYELGFMGKSWDASGVAFDPATWREALRVLKPGGHLIAFSGSRTYHRMAVAIEDAGFEIRDQIMWIYGSGFPKSHDVSKAIDKQAGAEREVLGRNPNSRENATKDNTLYESGTVGKTDYITKATTDEAKQWEGWGTALKPAHEPMVLARKPLTGTVAANVLTYGTGGLNIDGARVASGDNFDGLVGRPIQKLATQLNDETDEEYKARVLESPGQQAALAKLKELGRWPANVIHDGSDEVVALFPDKAGGGHWSKTKVTGYGEFGGGKSEYFGQGEKDGFGSAARFFYCAKASKRDRNEGLDGFEVKQTLGVGGLTEVGGAYVSIKAAGQNHHPTVKPTDLMRYLCRLITPPNGIVLDLFMGSGSTGKAAMYEGFKFIGVEMTDEYLPIAKARIEFAVSDNEGFLL
jgi:site-specific DNA-methyltransferase (adenine-specific)